MQPWMQLPLLSSAPAQPAFQAWPSRHATFPTALLSIISHPSSRHQANTASSPCNVINILLFAYSLSAQDTCMVSQSHWQPAQLMHLQDMGQPCRKQAREYMPRLRALPIMPADESCLLSSEPRHLPEAPGSSFPSSPCA